VRTRFILNIKKNKQANKGFYCKWNKLKGTSDFTIQGLFTVFKLMRDYKKSCPEIKIRKHVDPFTFSIHLLGWASRWDANVSTVPVNQINRKNIEVYIREWNSHIRNILINGIGMCTRPVGMVSRKTSSTWAVFLYGSYKSWIAWFLLKPKSIS